MKEKMKPTPGPWKFHAARNDDGTSNGSVYQDQRAGMVYCVAKAPRYATDEQWGADAALIAEAGTVHHETGLSPRELLEQRDGLLRALELAVFVRGTSDDSVEVLQQMEAAIAATRSQMEGGE